jgi:hypothetical protein
MIVGRVENSLKAVMGEKRLLFGKLFGWGKRGDDVGGEGQGKVAETVVAVAEPQAEAGMSEVENTEGN